MSAEANEQRAVTASDAGILDRLSAHGLEMRTPATPVANYVPVTQAGDLLFTSGQLPTIDGQLLAQGIVGHDVTADTARRCAEQCVLNALAAIRATTGSLASVTAVVKVFAAVASAPTFVEQSTVANAASDVLVAAFGDAGRHARTVLGVAALPLGAPVEVDLIVRVAANS